jgi:uncharacterized membrane protein YcgQ (UPF0703/DUF1980 family)
MHHQKLAISAAACLLLTATQPAMAKNLSSYQDIFTEMKKGKSVFALIDTSKCQFKQKSSSDDMTIHTFGIRMDTLFGLNETRYDGKRMNVIGFARHNWGGKHDYFLSRTLIHIWEDNTIDILEDTVDPTTYKLKDRDWLICKASSDGSGGATFSSN